MRVLETVPLSTSFLYAGDEGCRQQNEHDARHPEIRQHRRHDPAHHIRLLDTTMIVEHQSVQLPRVRMRVASDKGLLLAQHALGSAFVADKGNHRDHVHVTNPVATHLYNNKPLQQSRKANGQVAADSHLPAPFSVVLKVIFAPVAPATPRQKALTYVHHMIWLLMPENHSG